ncbi:MAG: S8 family serine peptidase [Candidatus Eisenbacteria bacterium]|nr:S8 family serine peptidase [Candidatus Eisenbacteria bacterium]
MFLPAAVSAAPEEGCSPNALIVRFEPGMDEGHSSFTASLEIADIEIPELDATLYQLGVGSFETIAPFWRHILPEERYDRHGNRVDLVDFADVYRITLEPGLNPGLETAIETLESTDGVVYAECDPRGEFYLTPDDPHYDSQWNLNNTLQNWPSDAPCDSFIDINAPQAWDIWDSAGTRIGISDGSIKSDHEDLSPYIDRTLSRSYVSGGWSGGGHGTYVAGVAAAGTDNNTGIAGVANLSSNHSDSLLVALRVKTGGLGDTEDAVSTRAANALSYVCSTSVYPEILVVNHSWGAAVHYQGCYDYNATLRDAFRNAFMKDISLVCAAGRGTQCYGQTACADTDTCIPYPAGYQDYAFAITGIRCDGNLLDNRTESSLIDLTAPGQDIWATSPAGVAEYDSSTYGTSVAAPHVSGAIALLLGREPDLTNEDCYQLLEVCSGDLSTYGHSAIQVGHGLLKVDSALAAVTYPGAVIQDSVVVHQADSIDAREQQFMNVAGLNTGRDETWETFWVHVYKLDKVAYLWDNNYARIDTVWCRGRTSDGWKNIDPIYVNQSPVYKYDGKFHANYAKLHDWDSGQSKATFRTYTYKIFEEEGGDFLGWYPEDPADALRIDYTVLVRYEVQGGGRNRPPGPALAINHLVVERLPARGEVALQLDLGRRGSYSLGIFDVSGRRVRTLLDEEILAPGQYRLMWDGRDGRGRAVAAGVYFARAYRGTEPGGVSRTARILLLR